MAKLTPEKRADWRRSALACLTVKPSFDGWIAMLLTALDALDFAELELAEHIPADVWQEGYNAAQCDCNPFRDPGEPYEVNPYRKESP